MKTIRIFIVSITLALLLVSVTQSRADGDNHDSGMMGQDHDGFYGSSEYMNITGEVIVDDSISISLSVLPNNDMQDMMNDNMDEDEISEMYQYMNRMEVKIFKLVEYYDNGSNGYTSDDTDVSEYLLNNQTLKQPVLLDLENKVSYEIESDSSNVFKMTLDIYSQDQMPVAIKWSYDINYPFVQSNTTLAIVHEVFSMNGSMGQDIMGSDMMTSDMMDGQESSGMGNGDMGDMDNEDMENHQSSTSDNHSDGMMMDDHEDLPMMFSWNETAVVDGKEEIVTATDLNEKFVLSIPQGENIFYDPQVSIDQEDVSQVESNIENIIPITVNTNAYLLIALAVIVGLGTFIVIKKK